jgi:hypothetical protein
MAPDEETLRADLASCRFKVGELRQKWKLVRLAFPTVYFRVRPARVQEGPEWFLLRTDCTGYRAAGPTGQLWNGMANTALPLEERPHSRNGVLVAFSPWKPCLYHPIDRMAREHWPNQHADLAWGPDKDITFFLETVYGLLHDPQYIVAKARTTAAFLSDETLGNDPA